MPNLVGLHDPSASRDALARDLARMMRAVDLPSFELVRVHTIDPPIACGNLLTGVEDNLAQPARDPVRGVWLMLDGELVNAPELRLELEALGDPRPMRDDAEVALALYLARGERFFERLNGQWNLVLHDAAARRTLLVSDRLGSRLLYYAEDGPRFTFASEAKGVVAGRNLSTRPGGLGLLQLLSAGSHVGDLTWLDGVRVLPPGTVVDLAHGRRRERYWKLRFHEGAPEASEDAYAEGFARALRRSTERIMRHRPGHPVAITLSGGLDSRSIALAIDRTHRPLVSITYGAPDSPDVLYAKMLADVAGFDHLYIEGLWPELVAASSRITDELLGPSPAGKRSFYSAQLDRTLWRGEAMSALTGLSSSLWHPLYRRHMRVMLNGACGDAMTGSHLPPSLLLRPSREVLVRDQMRRTWSQAKDLVEAVVAPRFFADYAPELPRSFASTFDEIDADEPFAISNVWDMENRQRRGTFTGFEIERYFCTCRSPYLDYDLVDVLRAVPGRWRFQQRIYKRMLVKHFPEARHVPWAYTRGPITASPAFELAREAYNFGKGRLAALLSVDGVRAPHWSFRDEHTLLREDRELAHVLERWVRSERFPSDVLSRDGVEKVSGLVARGERMREASTLYAHLVGIARTSELVLDAPELAVPPSADPARFGVDPRMVTP
ncbi:asparagine synthase-related protein [Myxococcota bacterium]|nr:asparagine synthase-related protein [Myxococcota bacterium]